MKCNIQVMKASNGFVIEVNGKVSVAKDQNELAQIIGNVFATEINCITMENDICTFEIDSNLVKHEDGSNSKKKS